MLHASVAKQLSPQERYIAQHGPRDCHCRCASAHRACHATKNDATERKLHEGVGVDLDMWATDVKPLCESKKAYRKVLQDQVEQ